MPNKKSARGACHLAGPYNDIADERRCPLAKQHAPQFLKLVTDAKTRVKECTVEDVRERLAASEPFVLVDVREESEFAAGHLGGATNVPLDRLR